MRSHSSGVSPVPVSAISKIAKRSSSARAESELAAVRHGVNRVEYQVFNDPANQHRIGAYGRKLFQSSTGSIFFAPLVSWP